MPERGGPKAGLTCFVRCHTVLQTLPHDPGLCHATTRAVHQRQARARAGYPHSQPHHTMMRTLPALLAVTLTPRTNSTGAQPPATTNPYGDEPYPVFWAVNGPNASAFGAGGSVDIEQYGIKPNNFTFCGDMIGGLMPSLSPDGVPVRGGVPQSANFSLAAFLAGLSKSVAVRIPDPEYDGLAVFDFEAFTPLWSEDTGASGWHSKAYRVSFTHVMNADSSTEHEDSSLSYDDLGRPGLLDATRAAGAPDLGKGAGGGPGQT